MARADRVPRIDITVKEILYESPIVFTPLADAKTIDVARPTALVEQGYARAGIRP